MPRPSEPTVKTYRKREHEELLKEAGLRLRHWRLKKELTMSELAEMMVDRGHHADGHQVRNWERGSIPNIHALNVLFNMGVDLNYFFTGKNKATLKQQPTNGLA